MISPLTDLLALPGFRTGVACGALAALAVAGALAATARRWPGTGIAFGAAAVAALHRAEDVGAGLALGLAALALGVCLVDGAASAAAAQRGGRWLRTVPVARAASAVPGALLVAAATSGHPPGWTVPALVVVAVAGGALAADLDGAHRGTGLGPLLVAVSAFGVYVTTPDTEHARVVLGAALPLALLGWPLRWARLGGAGAFVAVGLLGWTVAVDGLARDGAVVGGLACIGALAVEPVARRWPGRARAAGAPAPPTLVAAVHIALVAVCARVAGLRTSAPEALAVSGLAYAAALVALTWPSWRRAPATPERAEHDTPTA